MKRAALYLGGAAAMIWTPNPSLAQGNMGFGHRPEQRPAAFAGVNLRLEVGARGRPRPVARLAIGPHGQTEEKGALPAQRRNTGPAFELGLSQNGRPEAYVGGQPTTRVKERLGGNGFNISPPVILFSVVLVAVGVLVITNLNSLGDSGPAN